jgi:hypothetical protein
MQSGAPPSAAVRVQGTTVQVEALPGLRGRHPLAWCGCRTPSISHAWRDSTLLTVVRVAAELSDGVLIDLFAYSPEVVTIGDDELLGLSVAQACWLAEERGAAL